MDRDEIADGNSRAGVLLGLFQISIIGSLFLAIPINLVGLIFLKIKSKMGNETGTRWGCDIAWIHNHQPGI